MKKLSIILTLLLFTGIAKAQIQKGDVQLGGSLSINSQKSGDNKTNYFNISPRAGFFVSDNTSIGLMVGFNSLTQDVFDTGTATIVEGVNNQFQAGVYSRFHKSLADNFYIYLQPSLSFGSGKYKVDGTETATSNSINIGLTPGLTYFMSNRFAFELNLANLTYAHSKLEGQGTEETTDNFNLNLNLTGITLGLSYYIK